MGNVCKTNPMGFIVAHLTIRIGIEKEVEG